MTKINSPTEIKNDHEATSISHTHKHHSLKKNSSNPRVFHVFAPILENRKYYF
jgi:hypothetical protein